MTINITKDEIDEWAMWVNQIQQGYHISDWDHMQIIRINHKVLEASQVIHNANMLRDG